MNAASASQTFKRVNCTRAGRLPLQLIAKEAAIPAIVRRSKAGPALCIEH
jgi:hypothetical protein